MWFYLTLLSNYWRKFNIIINLYCAHMRVALFEKKAFFVTFFDVFAGHRLYLH